MSDLQDTHYAVGVTHSRGRRQYTYVCLKTLPVHLGSVVVVHTSNGLALGTVTDLEGVSIEPDVPFTYQPIVTVVPQSLVRRALDAAGVESV